MLSGKLERLTTVPDRVGKFLNDDRWNENKIDNLYSSLCLEGFCIRKEYITSMVEEHLANGPRNLTEIVRKMTELHDRVAEFDPNSYGDVLKAYQILHPARINPDNAKLDDLMNQLHEIMGSPLYQPVEKAYLAHYGFKTFNPFKEDNGIIGRLWQSLILQGIHPLFRFAPVDSLTYKYETDYHQSLFNSEEKEDPSEFMCFMLKVTDAALNKFMIPLQRIRGSIVRIKYFHRLDLQNFSRKDYMKAMDFISAPTASKDLALGVKLGLFHRKGTKRVTLYSCVELDRHINTDIGNINSQTDRHR
jgi:hypothetical protein